MNLSESVRQILSARDVFGELFYEEFFRSCPEARQYFADTDMHRQTLVVTMTLTTVQQYHDGGFPAVEAYLRHLGTVHHRRAIPLSLYPSFRKSMLKTLARMHGDEWGHDLHTEWGSALDESIREMFHGIESEHP